jgi:two-component sensor histidine kinase
MDGQEIHHDLDHYIKKNLPIIINILNLKLCNGEIENYPRIINEFRDYIKIIVSTYDTVCYSQNSSETHVNFDDCIGSLINTFYMSYPDELNKTRFIIKIKKERVDIDTAIYCSLIIVELLKNFVRYGFIKNSINREINIEYFDEKSKNVLTVSDNTKGIKRIIDFLKIKTFDLEFIYDLVENYLNGEVILDNNHGTKFKIIF